MKAEATIIFANEQESSECAGKYVASRSFIDRSVIRGYDGNPLAFEDPNKLFEELERMDIVDAVVVFWHDPEIPCIYKAAV